MFLGGAHARMGALEDAWHVYKARVGAPDPAAAAATAAALAGAGFTTIASPALRPAQRAALVCDTISHHLLLPARVGPGARLPKASLTVQASAGWVLVKPSWPVLHRSFFICTR